MTRPGSVISVKWDEEASPDMTNVDDRRADGPRSGGGLRFPFLDAAAAAGSGGLPIGKGTRRILGLVIALAVVAVPPRLEGAGRGCPFNVDGDLPPGAAGIRAGWTG